MRHNQYINEDYIHVSIFYREIIEQVAQIEVSGEKIVVDCTLGEGGHSEILLKEFPELKMIAFERDPEILKIAKKRLEKYGDRISFINDNFSNIDFYLKGSEGTLAGILYDYGISSYHFDASKRGFTFREEQPLDMRLDPNCEEDAAYIVNNYSEKKLADIIYTYGEERWAKKIAAYIVKAREEKPFKVSSELADLVLKAIPKRFHVKNIHPATRVFQALRIAVNNELDAISQALYSAWRYLAPGGRIMAISFHSLEDRIVKNSFRSLAKGCFCEPDAFICNCDRVSRVKILTRKPLIPGADEIEYNRRARSAKLRVCERQDVTEEVLSKEL